MTCLLSKVYYYDLIHLHVKIFDSFYYSKVRNGKSNLTSLTHSTWIGATRICLKKKQTRTVGNEVAVVRFLSSSFGSRSAYFPQHAISVERRKASASAL